MTLPWVAALAVEWSVLSAHVPGRARPRAPRARRAPEPVALPRFALAVLGVTLAGFVLASLAGLALVWVAAAGALALALRTRSSAREVVYATEPGFLVFVLALGVVVQAASEHGLGSAAEALVPDGTGLPALLAIAALGAIAANLVNNLPATLILLPATAAAGPGAVLAMLIGVNVGPNLTSPGRWRRCCGAASCTRTTSRLTSASSRGSAR